MRFFRLAPGLKTKTPTSGVILKKAQHMTTTKTLICSALLWLLTIGAVQAQKSALQKGHEAFRDENYRLAATRYSAHIVEYPKNAIPYYWRGMAHWRLEDLPAAIRDLDQAIKLRYPDRANAAYWKGVAELRMANFPGAIGSLTLAIEADYNALMYAYEKRGDAYYEMQDLGGAIADYKKALRYKHPDTGRLHDRIAEAYQVLENKEMALYHWARSLDAPDCPDPDKARTAIRKLEAEMKTVAGAFLWVEPGTAVSEVRRPEVKIEACLSTHRSLLEEVEVQINGEVRYHILPEQIRYSAAEGCEKTFEKEIYLQPGKNEVVLRAVLRTGEFRSETREIEYVPMPNVVTNRPKVWAMIVGVATYPHARSLRFSDDDAYRMFAFLKSPEGGAVPDENITLLIDEDATRAKILRRLEDLFAKAGRNDLVMMYFSGHGLPGSFVPYDYNGDKSTLLPHTEIQRIFRQTEARNRLCIADACHSGSLDKGTKTLEISEITDRYYSALSESSGGMALLMSSKAEENSIEYHGLRQGVFSHFLIRGLGGEADQDNDHVVRIGELYQYVRRNTKAYTMHRQNPELHGLYDRQMPVGVVR